MHLPVSESNLRQPLHAKHDFILEFGQVQLASVIPLSELRLPGMLTGHLVQFGDLSPYHPCGQHFCVHLVKFSCLSHVLSKNKNIIKIIKIIIINIIYMFIIKKNKNL